MTQESIKQEIKQLEAELEKQEQELTNFSEKVSSKGSNPYKSLYEYTSALLETSRIEKRILSLERDALWWERFNSKDVVFFDQQPVDRQPPPQPPPLVHLTDNVIQLPQTPTWRQQATRLHDEDRKEFHLVCNVARICAQSLSFPRDNSLFALIENMELIKTSSFEFNHAIDEIGKIYNEAYPVPDPADVIPFPVAQGGV